MAYLIRVHGDLLEREAADFIEQYFQYYESVWSLYIGNQGNGRMAKLRNYSYDERRIRFAENSYTVLESIFMIHDLLQRGALGQPVTNFISYLDFNRAFITLFVLIGRVRDTFVKASDALGYDNENIKESLKKFYEARSVVIHGKKLPLVFDENGNIKIPTLKTSMIMGAAWDDNHYSWPDIEKMHLESADYSLKEIFRELLNLINNEYAKIYGVIKKELDECQAELEFYYAPTVHNEGRIEMNISGSTSE